MKHDKFEVMRHNSSNGDELKKHIFLDGKSVLDIGCGSGDLVRYIGANGGIAFGLECNWGRFREILSATRISRETYIQGVGQNLPFRDNTFDVITFFSSLHHIPKAQIYTSLVEAARVSKSDGIVYVAEPLSQGPIYEMLLPVDDETEVRLEAEYEITRVPDSILLQNQVHYYIDNYYYKNFESMCKEILSVSPDRSKRLSEVEEYMHELFRKFGVQEDSGWRFEQPMRVNILKKP